MQNNTTTIEEFQVEHEEMTKKDNPDREWIPFCEETGLSNLLCMDCSEDKEKVTVVRYKKVI